MKKTESFQSPFKSESSTGSDLDLFSTGTLDTTSFEDSLENWKKEVSRNLLTNSNSPSQTAHISLPEHHADPLQTLAQSLKSNISSDPKFDQFQTILKSCNVAPSRKQNCKKHNSKYISQFRLRTWQEFNSAYLKASACGNRVFTEDEVLEKYKEYLCYGQEIDNAEKQYLQWLDSLQLDSLTVGSFQKQFAERKERMSALFTKLRWHLTDRFVPEVLVQPCKKQNRGRRPLPKEAIGILKKWLFNHFGHPYPNQLEKQQLALQTGLSVQQVSYWFINARVRIWKPLVDKFGKNNEALLQTQKSGLQPLHQQSSEDISST